MNELRDLARGDLIGEFVEAPPYPLSLTNVSGVSLRIDEYWLAWHISGWMLQWHCVDPSIEKQRYARAFLGRRYDFLPRPNDWSDYCKSKGYIEGAHPVLVIVILRQPMDKKLFADAPVSVGPHPIVYEYRPEAVGYSLESGDFIGGCYEGTIGGFLWHSGDLMYVAMSCAHVLGSQAGTNRAYSPKPTGSSKTEIGTVIYSNSPSSAPGTKCNNRIQPNAPSIDVGLVGLDSGTIVKLPFPTVGKITRFTPIADMGQNDLVQFSGCESGTVNAKVKECNIWKEIRINGTPVCFGDLFVLEDAVYSYLANTLANRGDSGAWVVNKTAGLVSWDGLLIGGDGSNVYCCYSETIMNCIDKNLIIPP